MRTLLVIHAFLVCVASGQSYSDFRSSAAAVSFVIENGEKALTREQEDNFLLYSTFMRGFLYGLEGASAVVAQSDAKGPLATDGWMLNPGKSAPSFLAFVAKHQPTGFDSSEVDTEGLKNILIAWYLDSHSKTKDPEGRSLAAKALNSAFPKKDSGELVPGVFVSREHGFIAKFPAKVEVMKIENALGPLTGYSSADEDKSLIYQLNVHDVIANRNLKEPSTDLIRRLVRSNFEAYCKESEASNVKWEWSTVFDWPTIEFSCSHEGFFREGVKSYKKGYVFLRGSRYYKVTVHGLEANKNLGDAALRFVASLAFPDEATLKVAEQGSAGTSEQRR